MSYNAMLKAKQRRAGGKQDWTVGSSQASSIGIPHNLVNKVSKETTTITYVDGIKKDNRNLVVEQNTLSGVGRYRSQFYVDADGQKYSQYYLDEVDIVPRLARLGDDWQQMFNNNVPNLANATTYSVLIQPPPITIETNSNFGSWAPYTSTVTNMNSMFYLCNNLTGAGLETWDVGNVTDMNSMFYLCNNLTGAGLETWDVGNVTDMNNMFLAATLFNGNISNWNVSNVESMDNMFYNTPLFNQDIGNWNVSKVTIMQGMLHELKAFNQDISSWTVTNVTNMQSMFSGAEIFNQDISDWEMASGCNIINMFLDCFALLDVGGGGFAQIISTKWNGAPNNISAGNLVGAGLPSP